MQLNPPLSGKLRMSSKQSKYHRNVLWPFLLPFLFADIEIASLMECMNDACVARQGQNFRVETCFWWRPSPRQVWQEIVLRSRYVDSDQFNVICVSTTKATACHIMVSCGETWRKRLFRATPTRSQNNQKTLSQITPRWVVGREMCICCIIHSLRYQWPMKQSESLSFKCHMMQQSSSKLCSWWLVWPKLIFEITVEIC